MIEPITYYSSTIPLSFFTLGPALVMALLWFAGFWAKRQRVPRVLENDWDGFNVGDVEKLFDAYGEERRARYRRKVIPVDMVFAAVYTGIGALIVAGVIARGYPWWAGALCGGGWLLGGLCDIGENLAIGRLLDTYPKLAASDVAWASRLTQAKLILFMLGVVGAVVAAWLVYKPLAA